MQTLGKSFISGPAADACESLAATLLPSLNVLTTALGFDFVVGADLKMTASKVLGCYKNSSTPLGVLLFLLSEGTRTRGRLETCRGHVSTRGGLRRSEGRVPPPAPKMGKLLLKLAHFYIFTLH